MGSNSFAPYLKYNTHFIVKNVTPDERKDIRIFHYPIPYLGTRDILQIPGVSESDIRASLLKGEILHKFLAKDIQIISSNIDLLQFSDKQRAWLFSLGFTEGVQVGWDELDGYTQGQINSGGSATIPYLWRENIDLIGLQNGVNRQFFTPDLFLDGSYLGNEFNISVYHNGRKMARDLEYTVSESGGLGTGFNTVNFIGFSPISSSTIRATYVIKAP